MLFRTRRSKMSYVLVWSQEPHDKNTLKPHFPSGTIIQVFNFRTLEDLGGPIGVNIRPNVLILSQEADPELTRQLRMIFAQKSSTKTEIWTQQKGGELDKEKPTK